MFDKVSLFEKTRQRNLIRIKPTNKISRLKDCLRDILYVFIVLPFDDDIVSSL